MRWEPSLTFEGALKILGHYEPRWIKRLDTALGGTFLVGGTVGTLAAGPAALPALGMFAAVWAWLEPKDTAIELLRQAVGKLSGKLAGTAGYERRKLIAAAHTTIVVAAFFEVLREQAGNELFDKLQLSDQQKAMLVADRSDLAGGAARAGLGGRAQVSCRALFSALYASEVPAPSSPWGFEENIERLERWNSGFVNDIRSFLLSVNKTAAAEIEDKVVWTAVTTEATERYRSYFLGLAATVPEFTIWANLVEHGATRSVGHKIGRAVAGTRADIAGLRADIAAALDSGQHALGRVEALLTPGAARAVALTDLRGVIQRANQGVLSETIIPAEAQSYGPDITFPTVDQIYVNPRYRAALVAPRIRDGLAHLRRRPAGGADEDPARESDPWGTDAPDPFEDDPPDPPEDRIPEPWELEALDPGEIEASDPFEYGPFDSLEAPPDLWEDDASGLTTGPPWRGMSAETAYLVADERWWHRVPARDDFDLMLAGYIGSPDATRVPMLLLGHPGAGKSMLVKLLAGRLPADGYTVVRVPLRRVGARAPVIDQIRTALDLTTHGRVREWWQLAERAGDTVRVVLLDGLDELLQASQHDRSGYLQEVTEFQRVEAEQGTPVVVLVTSRTVVADRVTIPDGTTVVKLDPFSDDDIADWVRRWASVNARGIAAGRIGELTVDGALAQPQLAQQPLLLLMLAIYAADPAMAPIDRSLGTAELYRRLIDGFARREAAKDFDRDPRAGTAGGSRDNIEQHTADHRSRLEIAALGMFNRGRQDIGEEELGHDLEVIEPRLMTRCRPAEAGRRIIAEFFFVHAPEARVEPGSDVQEPSYQSGRPPGARRSYEFLHATFGEYLVAQRILDELADIAAKAHAGRRGVAEPDDSLLFALLSQQPLAARQSVIEFASDIGSDLRKRERARIIDVLEMLLSSYRNPRGIGKFAAYQPTAADQPRQLACYSANLVVLRMALGDKTAGVPLARLLRTEGSGMDQWRSMVLLWQAALDNDGFQAMLDSVRLAAPGRPVVINALTLESPPGEDPQGSEDPWGNESPSGKLLPNSIVVARLIHDEVTEQYLRYGLAAVDASTYQLGGESWADTVIPQLIAGITDATGPYRGWFPEDFPGPPPGTSSEEINRVVNLVNAYLKRPRAAAGDRFTALRLLLGLRALSDIDERAFAQAVLATPSLMLENEELQDRGLYGEFWEIVRKAAQEKHDRLDVSRALRNPSKRTLTAIAYLLKLGTRPGRAPIGLNEAPWGDLWDDEPPF
jgi:energy-coupling factor transporter ATP-binding protein EcfA2